MIGKTIGHFQIESLLGVGGMGEVYRSRDMKLGRSVAVKFLPEAFANDPDRISRFEREAKVLASLNHPNIAALYGMEESGGKHFLVMELVEGETLAERLRRGPIPVEEALKIAHEIAEALEAAHEKSVVHRDLKPANVKITPEEKVKVLDFGLAKALENAPASSTLSNSPTLSMAATQAGVILGTAAYMSPEQAKGLAADARSDVFSFGCVLYEMLTGRQPFQGETAAEVLGAVLVAQPDFSALPPNLNPRIADLLRRCLDKNPKRRWQAIGDVRIELETIAAEPAGRPVTAQIIAAPRPVWRRAISFVTTVVIVSAIGGAIGWYLHSPNPAAIVTRFPVVLPEGQQFSATFRKFLAISPDGTRIAYIANQQLYVRFMGDMEARPIPGTSGPTSPFFSPDASGPDFMRMAH